MTSESVGARPTNLVTSLLRAVGVSGSLFLGLLFLAYAGLEPHLLVGVLSLMSFGVGFLFANSGTPFWLWAIVSFLGCISGVTVMTIVIWSGARLGKILIRRT
jgi:hypothetical protein